MTQARHWLAALSFIGLFLIPAEARASDEAHCVSAPADSTLQNFCEKLNQKLNHWAATSKTIKAAPCRTPKAPTFEAMSQHNAGLAALRPGEEPVTTTVHGVTFENESPRLISHFKTLTTHHVLFRPSKEPDPDQKTFASPCRKVLCATEEIFGKREGTTLLYMLDRYGYNGSDLAYNGASSWNGNELDDVLVGLSDLAPGLLPLDPDSKLSRFERGYTRASYGPDSKVVANATIELFDGWSDLSSSDRQMTIYHEVSHQIDSAFDLSNSPEWLRLSGWEIEYETGFSGIPRKKFNLTNPLAMVSEYAKENPVEDFAESMVAYRYNPEALKKASPGKYSLIRDVVMGGIEYDKPGACEGKAHPSASQFSLAQSHFLGSPDVSPEVISRTKAVCGELLFKAYENPAELENLRTCVARLGTGYEVEKLNAQNQDGGQKFRKNFLTNVRRPDPIRPPGGWPEKIEKTVAALKVELRASMIQALLQHEEQSRRFMRSEKKDLDPELYCQTVIGKYVYQSIGKASLVQEFDKFAAFNSRTILEKASHQACLEVRQKLRSRKDPMDAAHLEEALKRQLP